MSMKFLQPGAPVKPAVPPPFEVSPAKHAHAWWLHIWPFQSRKALKFMVIIMVPTLSFAAYCFRDARDLPTFLLLLSMPLAGGVYFGPYRTLPAKMTITTRAEARYFADDVKQLVLKMGYMASGKVTEPGHFNYCNKLRDKLGGWLSWDEQDLDLRVSEHTIELNAPIAALELLHRQLTKQLEA